MSEFVQRVIDWNKAAGRTDKEFNVRSVALHIGLQIEEMSEKMIALGFGNIAFDLNDMSAKFKCGDYDSLVAKADRTALLDADADIMVVTIGAMMASGANVNGALNEVCRSNESKSIECVACEGAGYTVKSSYPNGAEEQIPCEPCDIRGWILQKDVNGKITKGENYSEPNLKPFVCED